MTDENKYKMQNRIGEALQIRNMLQRDLVELTGIKKASINSWILQRWQPKQDAIYKIAKVLQVSEMWLAGYDVPMELPAEPTQNDELIEIIEKLRNDEKFRALTIKLSALNSEQLDGLMKLMNIHLD